MITTIAQALFDRLIAAFPPDRDYGRSDIRREPMPRALADYLEQVLHMKLRDALRESHLREAWIDAESPEVNEARAHFFNLAARHQGFPASVWADFLKNACCQTLYLVIQPTASLVDSVFDPLGNPATADTMRDRMGLYPARIPWRDQLETWLDEQGDEPVERDAFEAFARAADRRLAAESSPAEWLRLLDPLAKTLATAGHRDIPVEFLEAFLREKGAEDLLRYLGQLYDSKESMPAEKLEAFFTSGIAQAAESAAEPPREQAQPAEPSPPPKPPAPQPLWKRFARRSDDDAPATTPSEPASPRENGSAAPEPLWKQFRPASAPAPAEEAVEKVAASEQSPAGDGASGALKLVALPNAAAKAMASETRSVASPPEESEVADVSDISEASDAPAGERNGAGALADIEYAVLGERGGRNRGLFVECLFQGREDAYEAVLQRLHGARDWSEASQTIASDVFMKYQVNIYSPPAVAFTEAVEARYGA